jgi:hypothetical protein
MYRHRPFRRLTAWLLAVLVLFAQTAAVAYACAIDAARVDVVTTAPCPEHIGDQVQPASAQTGNLCEVHCQTPAVPDAGAAVAPADAIVAVHPILPLVQDAMAWRAQPPEVRGTPPPVHLRSTRLLI